MTAAQGSVAASSKLRCSGTGTRPSSCSTTILGQHAVDGAAQGRLRLGFVHLAGQPFLHEDAGNALADLARASRPGPTAATSPTPSESGDERQRQLRIVLALDDHQIAVVQRRRLDAHEHLVRPRLSAAAVPSASSASSPKRSRIS